MLNLYRRHTPTCPHRHKGQSHTKCTCPIWCDGELNGRRYRRAVGLHDWQRAIRKVAKLENPAARPTKTVAESIEAFHDAKQDLASSTLVKYRRVLRVLADLATRRGVRTIEDITTEDVDTLRNTRSICALTWSTELAILKGFFRFCKSRKWIEEDPAQEVKPPKGIKPADKTPYTPQEIARILAACDVAGRQPYARLRARAMILLLRYTALRISDVAMLERDRVRDGEIFVRTEKTGKPVRLPVYPELQTALDLLPLPRGGDGKYFFWSGNGSRESMVRDATRTLTAVFRASGVEGAHAHRFRHTLATEILERGGSLELAADVLGNSPALVAKHYAKWTARRQQQIRDIYGEVFGTGQKDIGTYLVHETKPADKPFGIN